MSIVFFSNYSTSEFSDHYWIFLNQQEKGANPHLCRNPPSLRYLRPLHLLRRLTYNPEHSWFFTSHPELGNNESLTPKAPSYITNGEAPKPRFSVLSTARDRISRAPRLSRQGLGQHRLKTAELLNFQAALRLPLKKPRNSAMNTHKRQRIQARGTLHPRHRHRQPNGPTDRGGQMQVPAHFSVQHRMDTIQAVRSGEACNMSQGTKPGQMKCAFNESWQSPRNHRTMGEDGVCRLSFTARFQTPAARVKTDRYCTGKMRAGRGNNHHIECLR